VAAADGKLLWKTALSTGRYQTCTPIVAGKMVVCAGNAFDLEKTTEGFTAKSLWKERAPHNYNSPTFKDDFIYGFSGMGRNSKLYCQDAKTGKVIWEDSTSRGECSFVLDAGSVLIGLSSDSNLFVFKPGGKEFQQIASYKVADSGTWADPILSGNRIIVKDKDSVILWTLD
jgi:outer membrane protein assembly factor BamB